MRIYEKMVAMFMVALIVSITYSIPIVMGYGLEINDASGADGYFDASTKKGWKKYTDDVTITLKADSDETIDNTMVKVSKDGSGYYSVDSCSGGTSATCTLTTDDLMTSSRADYTARLYTSSGTAVTSNSFSITPDYTPPSILSFSIAPDISNSGDFEVSYSVKDYAYSNVDGIGLTSITITEGGSMMGGFPLSINGDPVSHSGAVNISSTSGDGDITFCITATDKFDQTSSSTCLTKTVDTTPPSLLNMTVTWPSNDEVITYLSNQSTSVNVDLWIDSNDVSASNVKVNTSGLTGSDYLATAGSCSVSGGLSFCTITVSANIEDDVTPSFDFEVVDNNGNGVNQTLTSSMIYLDESVPEVTDFKTNHTFLSTGNYLLLQHSDFEVTVDEREFTEMVSLDLSEISGSSYEYADVCNETGTDEYTCYWYDYETSSDLADGNYTIAVNTITDSLGNTNTDKYYVNVTVDATPPTILSIGHEVIYATSLYRNRTVKGDALSVWAKIYEESNGLKVYANFSNLISTSTNVQGVCSELDTENYYNCTWETNPLDTDTLGTISYTITAYDESGNNIDGYDSVFVYGLDNSTSLDNWKYTVDCSPNPIDRQITTLVEVRSYCTITLVPKSSGMTPIEVTMGTCTDEDNVSMDYISSTSLINYGDVNPVVKVTLASKSMDVDSLNFYCPISILSEIKYSDYEKYVTTNYENENASMSFEFYNLPLGEYSQSMKDKINEVKDDSVVGWQWVTSLQELVDVLNSICQIMQDINSLMFVVNNIEFIWGGLEWNPYFTGESKAYGSSAESMDFAKDTFFDQGGIIKYCSYVTCSKSLWNEFSNEKIQKLVTDVQGKFDNYVIDFGDGESGFSDDLDSDPTGSYLELSAYPDNPKDSLILSIATLCIPGILSGIHRWRQIQCNYGSCLVKSMKMNMPASVCEDQKSYLECKYVSGEIFSVIPWVSYVKSMLNQLSNLLKDPLATVLFTAGYYCKPTLAASVSAHSFCVQAKLAMELTSVISMIMDYFDNGFDNLFGDEDAVDACEDFDTQLETVGMEGVLDD